MDMLEYRIDPFIKCVVLRVGLFESEIVDEANFSPDAELDIAEFKEKYIDRDDCVLVKIKM